MCRSFNIGCVAAIPGKLNSNTVTSQIRICVMPTAPTPSSLPAIICVLLTDDSMLNAGIGQVNVAGQKNTYHCVRSDTVVRMNND